MFDLFLEKKRNFSMFYFPKKIIGILFFIIIIYKSKQQIFSTKNKIRYIKDVLFIHGYSTNKDDLIYKYTILNQIEELNASFIESSAYFYLNFESNIVSDYRVIIFAGCTWTEKIEEAIILAKNLNKKILLYIDDLTINKNVKNLNYFSQNEKEFYNKSFIKIGKFLNISDGIITTNEYLSNELKNYASTIFINSKGYNKKR